MPALTSTSLVLSEARWNTQQWINAQPRVIALVPTRGQPVPKPGGGFDYPPGLAKDPQKFRLITQSASTLNSSRDDGEARQGRYTLVGAHDADVDLNDTWDEGPNHFRVDSFEPTNGYETRANVICDFAEVPSG